MKREPYTTKWKKKFHFGSEESLFQIGKKIFLIISLMCILASEVNS